ncbi:MAG: hypothetical protein M3Y21_01645 [Candidatus Eremiobacteraeota bacterium]|nr:hypothetical protein [Candidatus Eremiobacteraeota bacterium]
MSSMITQRELRNDSGRIMRALDDGESFIVTRNGIPVAELRPVRKAQFVRSEKLMQTASHLPAVDAKRFRTDVDAFIDQNLEPRA